MIEKHWKAAGYMDLIKLTLYEMWWWSKHWFLMEWQRVFYTTCLKSSESYVKLNCLLCIKKMWCDMNHVYESGLSVVDAIAWGARVISFLNILPKMLPREAKIL